MVAFRPANARGDDHRGYAPYGMLSIAHDAGSILLFR